MKNFFNGQKCADVITAGIGCWRFIIIQTIILIAWIIVNVVLAIWQFYNLSAWDPYPFILLNLVLSFQAAYTGPVVMMSQNRQSEVDRETIRMIKSLVEMDVKNENIMTSMLGHVQKIVKKSADNEKNINHILTHIEEVVEAIKKDDDALK